MNIFRKVSIFVPRLSYRNLARAFRNPHSYDSEAEDDYNSTVNYELLHPLTDLPPCGNNKVTIIGSGNVAKACAFGILAQKLSNEICIIDRNNKRRKSEVLDMPHGSIISGTNFKVSADSRVCIVCCGIQKKQRGTRFTLTKTNAEFIKKIIPRFAETSPDSILILVTNPVDIMTYVAMRVTGFPTNRVIGSGTAADWAHLRNFKPRRLQVAPTSGQLVDPYLSAEKDSLNLHLLKEKVAKDGEKVISGKEYINWATALTCAAITEAIIKDRNTVHPVSICAKGLYGIDKEVCLSLPCYINANGAEAVVKHLNELEVKRLHASAEIIYKAQARIEI